MSQELIEEEEYQIGNPVEFAHKQFTCMSSCSAIETPDNANEIINWTFGDKTALCIGERVLIDEAP